MPQAPQNHHTPSRLGSALQRSWAAVQAGLTALASFNAHTHSLIPMGCLQGLLTWIFLSLTAGSTSLLIRGASCVTVEDTACMYPPLFLA